METLVQDLRHAIRVLAGDPLFSVAAVLALALGIGANTAIFSVVNALLFRPLPVKNHDSLVVLASEDNHMEFPHGLSLPDYRDFLEKSEVFTDAIAFMPSAVNLGGAGQPERIWVEVVTENYFSMLGVEAARGRVFRADEGTSPGSDPLVVLSNGFWKRHFAGDPLVVGKILKINGHPFEVVGVAPEEFLGTIPLVSPDAYVPMMMLGQVMSGGEQLFNHRGTHSFRVIAQLKPDVGVEQARSALNTLAGRLELEYPTTNKGVSVMVIPENRARPDPAIGGMLPAIALIFMALVGLILLIACANVANLVLARSSIRQREFALRSALGASRVRLIRQLLTESVALAVVSAAVSLLLALWVTRLLASMKLPIDMPVRFEPEIDWRVFFFTLVLAITTGLITGFIPAFRATRVNLNDLLKEGGRPAHSSPRHRLRSALVVAQVAVSLLLLSSATLFIQSLRNTKGIDLAFRTDNLLMLSLDVGLQGYDKNRGQHFYRQLTERLRSLPGIRGVSPASYVPFGYESDSKYFYPEGRAVTSEEDDVGVFYSLVGTDYFEVMATPLLRGREFSEADGESAPKVAVINETASQLFWPGQESIGKRFKTDPQGGWIEVIGIAKNGKYDWLYENPRPFLYLPLTQEYASRVTFFVCTDGEPTRFIDPVKISVREIDEDLPPYEVKSMATHISDGEALFPARLGATLVGTFGLLGLILAAVGIYGMISYSVAQRTHEIGVRMALGAQTRDILGLVVWQAMRLTLIGMGIGVVAALVLTRALSGLLFGVSTTDPINLILAPALLAFVALVASYVPARRATRVYPVNALRRQ